MNKSACPFLSHINIYTNRKDMIFSSSTSIHLLGAWLSYCCALKFLTSGDLTFCLKNDDASPA